MATRQPQPLVVIVGPTASGKSDLALKLAKKYGGEIICADSRTVYKGMDIGTAKPTKKDQREIRHHLLDIVDPNEKFSAAEFQLLARKAILDIRARNKVPFLVGGTGLYIDSIIFDYQFGVQADSKFRKRLEKLELAELWEYCNKNNIELPQNKHNKRYVIRTIEQNGINNSRKMTPTDNCYIVGISTDNSLLRSRITQRAEKMFASGAINEAIELGKQHGWKLEAMTGNIYQLAYKLNNEDINLNEAKQRFITLDWRLAKRQLTWFRRNKYIHWYDVSLAYKKISEFLEARQPA